MSEPIISRWEQRLVAQRPAAALELAHHMGFHVFPVLEDTKRPDGALAPHGFKDATRDLTRIEEWWHRKPRNNIGVACGPDYGLVVFDFDNHDGNRRGLATLERLDIKVKTLTAHTPQNGLHLYFKHPRCDLPTALDGVDIKGARGGGYVLAPPSSWVHRGQVRAYLWTVRTYADELPVEVRQRLPLEAHRAPAQLTPIINGQPGAVIPAGSRHSYLVRRAGTWWCRDLEPSDIEHLVWLHASRYCDPPFDPAHPEDAREVTGIACEALEYWSRKPGRHPAQG